MDSPSKTREAELFSALASLSHELRTPLSAVLGWAQLGATGRLASDRHAETFEHIADAAWTIKRHIDDLFSIFALRSGNVSLEIEPLELGQIVASALETVRRNYPERSSELEFSDRSAAAIVLADRVRIAQIIENLAGNAFKHTPPGGTVRVALEPAGAAVRLSVHDSGSGLDPRDLERVFEPFVRVGDGRRSSDGLGLGLAITADIVRKMRGRIWAESGGPGTGASFLVEFPTWAPKLNAG